MKRSFFSENTKKKIKEKRFYIVLALCVLSISAIAYTNSLPKTENTPTENKNSDVEYSLPEPLETPLPPVEDAAPPAEEEIPEPEIYEPAPTEADKAAEPPAAEEPTETETVSGGVKTEYSLKKIASPSGGKILMPYSSSPTYSSIMGDWRTHEAVDFSASEGSDVYAAEYGKIVKISTTDLYGETIIIDHENSMQTIYSNVKIKDSLKEGDYVSKGDVIGSAANTSLCEKHEENHIHFEVMINGKNTDPAEWLE